MVMKMAELLSPARDLTSLNAAISNGADSVYLGISGYNLRAHKVQFKIEDLKEAVKRCHDSQVKLYVCTNTIMKDKDLESLKKIIPAIKSAGADAIIASDLGVLNLCRGNDINVHMSVQANISNGESLKLLKELGVSRVILSRELSLDEIKKLKNKSPVEVEVFIHGAMCMAISGRCFLSSYLYDKDANCGECLQPCRKKWKLVCEDAEEMPLNWSSGKVADKTHIMSPQDLCMVEHIPELIRSGVDAFKIEGRARPADYVATVTKVYRQAIDTYIAGSWDVEKDKLLNKWMIELRKVFNRGFDTGFYFRKPYETSKCNKSTHRKQDVGEVVNFYSKVSAAEIKLWNDLGQADEVIIQGPTTGSLIQKVKSMQINGEDIKKGSKGQNVAILVKDKVRAGDLVYKRLER